MKPLVLIVDDNPMNRMVLSDMLGDDYRIAEACDGEEAIAAVQERGNDIALMLLDVIMPKVNGLEVLEYMNSNHQLDTIPVIIVSAESETETVSKAFDLGATDYLNRNFDARIVKRRVENAIMLYAKQKRLVGMVASQIYERERSNSLMISILSHTVEFRNQESGMHVQNVRRLTELILEYLKDAHPELQIDAEYVSIVSMASALHDIGKIAVPEEILNKPGRLTDEEFAIMKTHSLEGAKMLEKIPSVQSEPLVKSAYEIARWHHERWNGRGYPDGLKGDNIPLSAQVVSLADVYDALTSERAYKSAFSHEKACEMILNDECGQFNPMLMEALKSLDTKLADVMDTELDGFEPFDSVNRIVSEISTDSDLTPLSKTLEMLETEKEKYNFFSSLTDEIHFEYLSNPSMLVMPDNSAEYFGLNRKTFDPWNDEGVLKILGGREGVDAVLEKAKAATSANPVIDIDVDIYKNGEPETVKATLRVTRNEETGEIENVIGRLYDSSNRDLDDDGAKPTAKLDPLTGLYDEESFEGLAKNLLAGTDLPYAMITVDIDEFKSINDEHGHIVGNNYLKETSDRLRYMVRNEDLIARVGGDEFLVLAQFGKNEHSMLDRIQKNLSIYESDGPNATVSIGVAFTEDIGRDFVELVDSSDKALYLAKDSGKNKCVVYEEEMADVPGNLHSDINGTQLIYGWRKTDLQADNQM